MANITVKFSSVEAAETATSRLKLYCPDVDRIIISRRRYIPVLDTPFMLPYKPIHGRDSFIMRPEWYGHGTASGYLEAAKRTDCSVDISLTHPELALSYLINWGGWQPTVSFDKPTVSVDE